MTKSFALDANHDLYLDGGDLLATVTALGAVLQNCDTAAKTLLGEMVLAANQGVPYFQSVWVGQPNIAVFETSMRQRLGAVEGVTAIVELTTRQEGNVLKYVATIATVYGEAVLDG